MECYFGVAVSDEVRYCNGRPTECVRVRMNGGRTIDSNVGFEFVVVVEKGALDNGFVQLECH